MTNNRPIWMMALSQTIVWAGIYYMFPAMILRFEAATGWTKTELTTVFTIAMGISALASPLAGRLIDRGHGPAVLTGSTALGGVAVAGLAAVETIWQFAALWAVLGFAMAGGLYIPCFSLVTRVRGASARGAITRITLIAGLAGTVSFPTAHLMSDLLGWRGALLVFAGAILTLAVPLTHRATRRLEAEHRARRASKDVGADPSTISPTTTDRAGFLRHPTFWLLAVCFAGLALTHGVCITHMLPILEERRIDPDLAVLAASSVGPMQVLGRLMMLAVERRLSSRAITMACFVALMLAVIALLAAEASPLLLLPFVFFLGSGAGVTSIMKPVVTRDILGEADFGAVSGALAVPFLAAFALAPVAGSLLWEAGGYDLVLMALLAVAGVGLAAFVAASRRAA